MGMLDALVNKVADEFNVDPKSVEKTESLMKHIEYALTDKMADMTAIPQMAKVVYLAYNLQLQDEQDAEKKRIAEIQAYWDKKILELS